MRREKMSRGERLPAPHLPFQIPGGPQDMEDSDCIVTKPADFFLKAVRPQNSPSPMCACVCTVIQSCLTLCDPMDYSSPGFSVRGISQAKILE